MLWILPRSKLPQKLPHLIYSNSWQFIHNLKYLEINISFFQNVQNRALQKQLPNKCPVNTCNITLMRVVLKEYLTLSTQPQHSDIVSILGVFNALRYDEIMDKIIQSLQCRIHRLMKVWYSLWFPAWGVDSQGALPKKPLDVARMCRVACV